MTREKEKAEIEFRTASDKLEVALKRWKKEVGEAVENLNKYFAENMKTIGMEGSVKLVQGKDPWDLGLEIYSKLNGRMIPASSRVHSGGEKTLITIAFIISIQRLSSSPFKIIDEFEAHLDSINAEKAGRLLANASKNIQYIVITPTRWAIPRESNRVIFVEKSGNLSTLKLVKQRM